MAIITELGIKLLLFSLGFFVPLGVYVVYFIAIMLFKEKELKIDLKSTPKITVVIPMYNEEEVIAHRIKNLANLNYPKELLHVILIDDASTDNSIVKAKEAFQVFGISGKVIQNKTRKGTNYNFNVGVRSAQSELVLTTDADVTFEKNAVSYLLTKLQSDPIIGAACGELLPIIQEKNIAASTELPYRSLYGKMCSWESAIGSCYCFNGPLILLRKSAFSKIPEESGASDASAALNVLQHGFKTVYVKEAKFSELITLDITKQRTQKVRRAARLLEASWNNRNLLFNKTPFGNIIFLLRCIMFFVVPAGLFVGITLLLLGLMLSNQIAAVGVVSLLCIAFVVGKFVPNMISSFLWHQVYLVEGLTRMYRKNHLWKSIERRRV